MAEQRMRNNTKVWEVDGYRRGCCWNEGEDI